MSIYYKNNARNGVVVIKQANKEAHNGNK